MNEEQKQQLGNLILEAANGTKDAIVKLIAFLSTQTPEVIREYLLYNLLEATILAIFWAAGAAGIMFGIRKIWVFAKECYDPEFVQGMFAFFGGILAFGFLVASGSYALKAIKISVAPRVYIIEQAIDIARDVRQ